jgi:CAAX prenyl protease-like protein
MASLAGTTTGLTALVARATAAPAYAPDARDLDDVRVAGVDLPARATTALVAATALVLADQTHLVPGPWDGAQGIALERFVLFGAVPFLLVVGLFRDGPRAYGLTLGEWRWGLGLLLVGLAVMTPIILALSRSPEFAAYYGAGGPAPAPVAYRALELFSAEFALRGFLLFALLRRIGPLALVIVQVPFIFAHIGKPELELWSTFVGGSVFAWLNWRTGSIVWSALGHLYVLTLMIAAAGGAAV